MTEKRKRFNSSRFNLQRRTKKGAMAAEYVATMYLLFMFIFFPVLNLATVSINAFFLWFACNAGAQMAAKSPCFNRLIYVPANPPGTPYPGAYDTARARASQIRNMFPGIGWTESATNPRVDIIMEPINPASGLSTFIKTGPSPLSGGDPAPDPDEYTMLLRVTINGFASPLINVPWFDIPGLSKPMDLIVTSQAQFENPPGLRY